MDYDDDLWGPPSFVEDDTYPNQTLPGCEFWFDPRTDVIEENYLNEKYCEQAWQIMNNKQKPDAELQKNSDSASASTACDPITTITPSFEPTSKRQKMNETKESFNDTGLGLNSKQKPDAELQKDSDSASASVQNDMATSDSGETHAIVRSVAEVEVTCVGVENDNPNEHVASPLGQITCFDLNSL